MNQEFAQRQHRDIPCPGAAARRANAVPRRCGALALLVVLASVRPAAAQSDFDTVGTRAQGMGGAFVALADDASGVWWNPAGVATLGIFDAVLEGGRVSVDPNGGELAGGTGAWRAAPFSVAAAVPALAFSYTRLHVRSLESPATAAVQPGRQEGAAAGIARVLRTDRADVTLVQSIADVFIVGATLGVVRGATASMPAPANESIDEALDGAGDLATHGDNAFDAHVGVLAFAGPLRLGLVARNLGRPEFEDPAGGRIALARQVRAGVAYGGGGPAYARRPWSVAVDADLVTVHGADGARRAVAAGVERWWADKRVALRGGARMQTVGDLRPQASGGASVALRPGFYVEGQVSGGADEATAGWSLAARITY
jgi:hypothetical protein